MPPVVTLTETKQLYWFGHGGAITDGSVRQRLRRAWGLCPRHTWLLFCVEHELRYLPIGAAKLYQDLTWHATVLLAQRHTVTQLRRALDPHASCLTCDGAVALMRASRGRTVGAPVKPLAVRGSARVR
jgi:hypothetical protein